MRHIKKLLIVLILITITIVIFAAIRTYSKKGISIKYSSPWSTFQGFPTRIGRVKAKPITKPKILWKTKVGIQSWLNNPIIVGGQVVVGSSGQRWNKPDDDDGVYSFDIETGKKTWFASAQNDVNGISYSNGLIIATGDEGAAWALKPKTGDIVWSTETNNGKIYTSPLLIKELAIVGDANGTLYALDIYNGSIRWSKKLKGIIRGGSASDGSTIYTGTTDGNIAAFSLNGKERWKITLTPHSTKDMKDLYKEYGFTYGDYEDFQNENIAEIYATPTIVDNLLIIPFARDTSYEIPALVAIDRNSGKIVWRASNPKNLQGGWGNIRSSPAVYKNLLIYGEPYSNRIVAVETRTGLVKWSSPVGDAMFPHWPSPAIAKSIVILPRHDGGLYAVNADTGKLLWSLFLGKAQKAGNKYPTDIILPDEEPYLWDPLVGKPIFSSPAIAANGTIFVGTGEGYLFAIGENK